MIASRHFLPVLFAAALITGCGQNTSKTTEQSAKATSQQKLTADHQEREDHDFAKCLAEFFMARQPDAKNYEINAHGEYKAFGASDYYIFHFYSKAWRTQHQAQAGVGFGVLREASLIGDTPPPAVVVVDIDVMHDFLLLRSVSDPQLNLTNALTKICYRQ